MAAAALDAPRRGETEAIVAEWSRTGKAGLSDDHALLYPGIEAQFARAA